ncbi:phage major capsid protein, P2 family [Bowmanella denitrificans]|uniref:phage major capsid protein, P2 family n=1 Tax=Bowmanella denitrificans TaxID=366582 RepID=UPI000C9ABB9D|nr:phage major capsid protein, P2 family [Bowmanella denitrificans]
MLSTASRNKFAALLTAMAATYGVESVAQQFAAEPSLHQELMDKVVLHSDFLQRVNVLPVTELKGEKLLGSVNGLVTTRTDTSGAGARVARELLALDQKGYELFQTNMDTAIRYIMIDTWAKFPDLVQRYQRYIQRTIATNKVMIGWHGTSIALTTDPETNPLGQDVNKGWLQILREQAPAQVLTEGDTAGKIILGASGDFENLNSLAYSALTMIPEEYADAGDLVVIAGRELIMRDKGRRYAQHGELPSEKEKIEMAQTIDTYGGLPTYTVPYFPARGLLVTSFDNLSLYYQSGSMRRHIKDHPEKNRYEDYMSQNEGYVVEELEKAAYIEGANVEFVEEQTGP